MARERVDEPEGHAAHFNDARRDIARARGRFPNVSKSGTAKKFLYEFLREMCGVVEFYVSIMSEKDVILALLYVSKMPFFRK